MMAHGRGAWRGNRDRTARRVRQVFRHFVFLMIGALLAVPYIVVFIWTTQVSAVEPAGGWLRS